MATAESTWITAPARALMESMKDSIDLADLVQEVSLRKRDADPVDAELVQTVIEEMRLRGEAGLFPRPE